MNKEEFILYLKKLNIDISENSLNNLDKYYQMLIEWNQKMDLTAITDKDQVYLKHFYDSLTICSICDLNTISTLCDVGTGAGFPGLVLKIIFPHLKITLLDSLDKRLTFLKEVIKNLKLNDVEVIHARAEDYAKNNRDKFDIVTSRAVAKLNVLIELCLPIVKINGYFIAMKANAIEEIEEAKKGIKILNSEIKEIKNFILPFENSARTLIKIKRINIINEKYPRKFVEIKKNPL